MNGIKVKICGIRNVESLQTAIHYGVDYVGFVFYPPSLRSIGISQAVKLSELAMGKIKRVGLFVDENSEKIAEIIKQVPLDMIQLHGKESPEFVQKIKEKLKVPVIKAYGIAEITDILDSQKYWDHADIMLFDAKAKKGEMMGGLGRSFLHSLLNHFDSLPKRWWLAGGFSSDNVIGALATLRKNHYPEVVDVSSGVEIQKGVKDPTKMKNFMQIFGSATNQ